MSIAVPTSPAEMRAYIIERLVGETGEPDRVTGRARELVEKLAAGKAGVALRLYLDQSDGDAGGSPGGAGHRRAAPRDVPGFPDPARAGERPARIGRHRNRVDRGAGCIADGAPVRAAYCGGARTRLIWDEYQLAAIFGGSAHRPFQGCVD